MPRWFVFRNTGETPDSCKICLRTDGVLVHPCHCEGPQALVHSECIYHQLTTANRLGCDSCETVIRFEIRKQVCLKWKISLIIAILTWFIFYFGTLFPIWSETETWEAFVPKWGIHSTIFLIIYPLVALSLLKKMDRTEWIYEALPGFPNILVL